MTKQRKVVKIKICFAGSVKKKLKWTVFTETRNVLFAMHPCMFVRAVSIMNLVLIMTVKSLL